MRNSIFNLSSSIFNLSSAIWYLLFAICYLLSAICYAQPTEEWVARYYRAQNSGGVERGNPSINVDRFGNCCIVGYTLAPDSVESYTLAVKYNSSGIQQWTTQYRHPGYTLYIPRGSDIDSSGNIYATFVAAPYAFDPWGCLTVKFSAVNGAVVWARIYRSPSIIGGSEPWAIKTDRYNNSYVVGNSDSSLLVIKYSPYGDSLWVRRFANPPPYTGTVGVACVMDDSLNLLATGLADPPPGSPWWDMITVKYSSSGVLRWTRFYNRIYEDMGRAIDVDASGNVYVTGPSLDQGFDGNYATIKYSPNGVQQWVSIYKGPGAFDHIPVDIAASKTYGYVYVTGESSGLNNLTDYATIRYNPANGDSIWVKRFNGTSNLFDVPLDLALDNQGNAYVTGRGDMVVRSYVTIKYFASGLPGWTAVYSYANLGDIATGVALDSLGNVFVTGGTYTGSGGWYDYVTIKYNQLLGIEEANKFPGFFKLFQNHPNPFNSRTSIKFGLPKSGEIKITVYDIIGREISVLVNDRLDAGIYEAIWDANNFSSGIYFYSFITETYKETRKAILIK